MPGSYSEKFLAEALDDMEKVYRAIGNDVHADAIGRIDKLGVFDLNECMVREVRRFSPDMGFDPFTYRNDVKNAVDEALCHMWVSPDTKVEDIVCQLERGGSARKGLAQPYNHFKDKYAPRIQKNPREVASAAKAAGGTVIDTVHGKLNTASIGF